jgi:UDP-N-acetyl-D-glucosamine dehydrogenase
MADSPALAAAQGAAERLGQALESRTATVGIIGLGYVGLPLAMAVTRAGFVTVGFDVDEEKTSRLNAGASYIHSVTDAQLAAAVGDGRFHATADFGELGRCDVIVICVPTPLNRYREPDLSYVVNTAETIRQRLRSGQLIVLESTTYPGTTVEVVKPILESTGLKSGRDVFLGFSPEREDPGNAHFETATIPKVVSGEGPDAQALMQAFYGAVIARIVPVSSPSVAEAVKITENIFRSVNIALVNELKVIYDAMGIDVWEVIDAAATKPFGYMPFYPGPGLGGHCIPIDPFYLSWKAREYDLTTRFIELAGEINVAMPRYVLDKLDEALDRIAGVPLSKAKVLVIGVAYKKNVADVRESPSFKLIKLLEDRGAAVCFHDPYVDEIPPLREHPEFSGRRSVALDADVLAGQDAVVVVTDHDNVDYASVAAHSRLIVDTRNAFRRRSIVGPTILRA